MSLPRFSSPTPTLTTSRLVLRPLVLDDAPAVQEQFERWEVVRYLNKSVPWPYPPDGAENFQRHFLLPRIQDGLEMAWAITLDGKLIGAVSLSVDGDENRGFWLTPEHWGRGLMTEASERVTRYAMDELRWPHLLTGSAAGNEASARIKKSQGFERVAVFAKEFVGGMMEYEQWKLTQESWLRCHPEAG